MKKFLFTSLISHDLGLITRSLPIARELRARGHQVEFCHTGKAQCKTIADAGFEIIPYEGPLYYLITGNVNFSVLYRIFRSGHLRRDFRYLIDLTRHLNRFSTAEVWNADHFDFLMGAFHAGMVRHAVDYWISVIRTYNPDAVVDFWNSGACAAARFCGTPLITVIQADMHPQSRGFMWWKEPPADIPSPVAVTNQIRAERHLPLIGKIAELFVGDKTLVVGMPETDPLPDTADVTYIGPVLWQNEQERPPDWFADLSTTEPVIWLYPGNPQYMPGTRSYGDSQVVATACIAALKDKPVQVIYSGGHHPVPRQARPLPSNFRYVSYVPGLDMAARSDLMIHHGGYGSCQTGLFTGTPSLVIPTYSERESNARRVASVGAGDFVLPTSDATGRKKRVDAAEVSAKVDRMLSDASYKDNARKMSARLKSYGGAAYAAELIEDAVKTGMGMGEHWRNPSISGDEKGDGLRGRATEQVWAGEERRRHDRQKADLLSYVEGLSHGQKIDAEAKIMNLSRVGLYVESEEALDEGTEAVITAIRFGETFWIKGKVLRSTKNGMAIGFEQDVPREIDNFLNSGQKEGI